MDRSTFLAMPFKTAVIEIKGLGRVVVRELSAANSRLLNEKVTAKATNLDVLAWTATRCLYADENATEPLLTDDDVEAVKLMPFRVLVKIQSELNALSIWSDEKKDDTSSQTSDTASPSDSAKA